MKIVVTDSTGVEIPISIGDGKTFPDFIQIVENERGMRMKFNNLQEEKYLGLDQNILTNFSEEEAEAETYLNDTRGKHVGESPSLYSENVLRVVIPTQGESSRKEPEIQEQFHAVMERIKREEMEMEMEMEIDEGIETVDEKPIISSKNNQVPISEQSPRFYEVILEPTDHPSMALLCRLCATQCNDMIYIFRQNEEYKNIIDMIINCLPIMVKASDTLPKQVCRLCLENLELCYKFRETVAEAEKQLIILDEKISEQFENAEENCSQNSLLDNVEKEAKKDAKELVSDEKTSEKEEEYLRPKSFRSSGFSNQSAKKSAMKNRGTLSLCDGQEDVKKPAVSVESDSDGKSYTPPVTRSSKSSKNGVKKLREKGRDTASGKKSTNDHTYASQSEKYNTIKCRICGIPFETASGCYFHSSIHSSEKYHPCGICNKNFKSEQSYCKHSTIHTRDQLLARRATSHVCKLCHLRFGTADRLEFHNIYHDPEVKSCYCEKCDKLMASESKLYLHMIDIHKRPVEYSCNICGKLFGSQLELKLHQGKLDPKYPSRKPRPFECLMCKSTFYSPHDLELHRKHHCRASWNFTCSYCGKSFSRKWSLSNHLKLHTEERPYTCKFCTKTYQTKRNKHQHEILCHHCNHVDGGRFKCKFCEEEFINFAKLRQHENVRTKYKPDYATKCSDNAIKKDKNKHMRMEKGFQCDVCGKYFLGPTTLQIHKRAQHK